VLEMKYKQDQHPMSLKLIPPESLEHRGLLLKKLWEQYAKSIAFEKMPMYDTASDFMTNFSAEAAKKETVNVIFTVLERNIVPTENTWNERVNFNRASRTMVSLWTSS
jgi:hypothetical protein